MTNQDLILQHLKKHSITKLMAAKYFNCFNLGDVGFKLRNKGFNIETQMIPRDKRQSYAVY